MIFTPNGTVFRDAIVSCHSNTTLFCVFIFENICVVTCHNFDAWCQLWDIIVRFGWRVGFGSMFPSINEISPHTKSSGWLAAIAMIQ